MKTIFENATKLVLLVLTVVLSVGFIMGKVESKDFMVALMSVFSFYFAYKGNDNKPYAGK